ncbi:hypothetical protein KOI35_46915 [Actinoplanes bogorensis]|uniref:Uncharacterized protein n=1 Tax=Paractinoplanes bogorensis TaxID=1610840 RepID=A0ABS5Z5T0_9ACTN|nr:hypothetical protein [Actinoplanes bogorensis]MBU2671054.1 hypothetical protein [Actinoplanes bogorensis]
MSRGSAFAWLLPGFVVSVIDAWLSMQSMVGIIQPKNILAFVAAVLLGMALTAFAVLSPLWTTEYSPVFLHLIKYLLVIVDVGTSIIGAIWYGLMGQPLNRTVHFEEMHWAPSNWFATTLIVGFVVIVAWFCHMFGLAMRTLKTG